MPFIPSNIGSAVEPQVQPEGPHDLVVRKAEVYTGKESKKESIRCIIDIQGVPNAASVFHYIPLVHPGDDEEMTNNKLLMQKRFFDTFNIPYEDGGFNTDDIPGSMARVFLGVEPDNNGIDRNVLQLGKKI